MVTIDLSAAPKDRLMRAFNYLAVAIAKQPKTDFFDPNSELKKADTKVSSG